MQTMWKVFVLATLVFAVPAMAGAGPAQGNNGTAAQTIAAPYQIGTWQGFRPAAVSYTFDDNIPHQLSIAVPMFDTFGFKLTLFTVTSPTWGWPANWAGLQQAANEGHEIASHTIDHQPLGGLTDPQQQAELQLSRDTINARITGQQCVTFAYPNCILGNSALVAQYYIAARGCSGQIVNSVPPDSLNISSFVLGDKGLNTVADIEAPANNAALANAWCVYLIHGINSDEPGAYSPLSQDTMLATLQYFSLHPDKFWVATFGTVARYIQERKSASITELSSTGDSITVQLTDLLGKGVYTIPLSVRRPLPAGWDSAVVMQNDTTVPSKVITIDTVLSVMFDAVPNAGIVTIMRAGATVGVRDGNPAPAEFGLLQNYPNPFNPSTTISYQLPSSMHVKLTVFDLLGRQVETLVNERENAGNHSVVFDASNLPSGVYFSQLSGTSGLVATRRMVLVR